VAYVAPVTGPAAKRGDLDSASSAPLHPAAREVLLAALDRGYADPRRLHRGGREARLLLDNAREATADALGVRPDEVTFTPSGTHAVHLGLLGLVRGSRRGDTVALPAVEHSAVRHAVEWGAQAVEVGVEPDGRVRAAELAGAASAAGVVALQTANHEVGTLQPVGEVDLPDEVPLFTDACASMGRLPLPDGWQVEQDVYAGFARDLAKDEEAELLAIPRKQRAEVRKALASDLKVTVGVDAEHRAAHYRVYATSVRNLGTPVFPKALFGCVLDAFGDNADILTVHNGSEAVASVLSLYWRGTVMPYWGGGLASARTLRANELMYFALMNHARAKGCTRFDFGRSKLGTGPFAYKKNWGFEPQPLTYARWLAAGESPRDTNPTSAKYRLQVDLWKKLPLWAANRMGPLIARGLG